MRIRQVKPEFWRDSVVAELPDTVRLVYIGLWGEADDAGFFRFNFVEIANDLYPLTSRHTRERRVSEAIAALIGAGRIERLPCDRHCFIPHLTEHQRLASPDKRVTTVQREHKLKCSEAIPAETRGDSQTVSSSPTWNGKEGVNGKEKERGGVGGSADGANGIDHEDDDETPSPFQAAVPRPRLVVKQ